MFPWSHKKTPNHTEAGPRFVRKYIKGELSADSGHRTLQTEGCGDPNSDDGGLGGKDRRVWKGEFSLEWSNECESVKDGVCRVEVSCERLPQVLIERLQ